MARGIYKIINAVNNKFYVGSAVNFEKRKTRHIWRLRRGDHVNKHLQSAWNKYGESSFVFVLIQEVPESEDLLAAENVWLHEHVGKPYCYNKAVDAIAPTRGFYGEKNPMWGKTFTHTEDAKLRIGAASKARVQSEAEKSKRRNTMKGHAVSTETRLKLSKALSGEGNYWHGKNRPDHGAKVSKSIIVTTPNGKELEYASILELRTETGMTPTTVNRALKSGKAFTKGKYIGCSIRYK